MRSAIVIAGGRSTRFRGGDKALAAFDGEPMIRRVADRVGQIVDELVVNCRAPQVRGIRRALSGASVSVRFAIDDVPDRGPVPGMAKGLRVANGSFGLVTACDMPLLDPAFLDSLFEEADEQGAVPVFDGVRQPLCAVYGVEAATCTCHTVLADGEDDLQAILERLDPIVLPEATVRERTDATTFENVNTAEDLERLEERVRPDGTV